MSGLKDLAKGGWHPKGKTGGKESWRGDFKGANTVAGWMGKGKDTNQEALDHQSAPLSTLKDPASFGPPPKRTLAAAPDSSGLGAPVPTPTRQQRLQEAEEEEEANKPPPGPYRADTTGLSTAQLPKPPLRRPGQAPSPPPSRESAPKPKPKLPPRLPPRQNSHPDAYAETPPPTYNDSTQDSAPAQGYLNQSALDRLGQSGVSVPGFNIGRTASPPIPPRQNAPLPSNPPHSPVTGASHGPQLSELQSRFAKMSTPSVGGQTPAPLNTSNSNSVLGQHGEKPTTGRRTPSSLAQKYGIANVGMSSASPIASPLQSPTHSGIGKKPPPPPPPKKKELTGNAGGEAPPVPLGSKPKF
ncbi:hypothetical protein K505DRAFT_336097 [Melanomma pulvis-pyrius CBS 109.77]|uniref:Uncharacterized protein n=1 Tax=Melanomma pulvis-pyrius CBS 109.77 TaxID=1314802 RepID=A0A6A6XFR1_9PLEO|nr:hypothetical protein K505DRAFT_336097 [Melanomma pulvis-pyrius CBS 109.77]